MALTRALTKFIQGRGTVAKEAQRQASAFGRIVPESAPDAEEIMRRNRRKFFAQQRRRSGRMSTILTGGDDSGMGLG